jgi:arabinogalactan oligomer/maltooligosaccharide transport system substrate-binding protein
MTAVPCCADISGAHPRRTAAMACLCLILALAACSTPRDSGIVLWHSYTGLERDALEASAARWNAVHPTTPIVLVSVPNDAFADKISSAVPRGNGPDLFIYAHDRIGDWADAGVIEPIEFWVDDARADRFEDRVLGLMAYHGSLWGLPLAVKSLALFYRTDLVPTPPRTTDDIVQMAPALRARGKYALTYANVDLYYHAPWLFAYGGQIFDAQGKLALASPQAAAAMTFARALVRDEVVPKDQSDPQVASLFDAGNAAMAMSGPWFIADIAEGVPWKVTTLPIVSTTGKPATPFVGAESIVMSARAHDKGLAFAAMDFLTSDASAIERAKLAHQLVPNTHAYDDPAIGGDPVLATFRAQLEHVEPMSNDPTMRMVWTPYKAALGDGLDGRVDPGERLLALQHQIEGYAEHK